MSREGQTPVGINSRQPRILITRLSAIGDCLQTVPAAWALREHFPEALIAWAVEPAAAPLISAVSAVDQVIVVPKRMLASPPTAWRVRGQLRPWQFDVTIDPQSLSKSAAVAWLSGAGRRIGFQGPSGREISPWLNNDLVSAESAHMVERYLELLRPLEIDHPRVRFDLNIDPQSQAAASTMVERLGLSGGFAAINPGAGWDSKRWPAERFAALVRELGQRHALPSLVVWAGARERQLADQIAAGGGGHAAVAPRTGLLELAALLQQARLMVASDTGPLHLAAALGTPTVGIFGSTRKEACGPYGPRTVALQRAYDGSAGRKLPGADNWAVRRVTLDSVLEACHQLLEKPPTSRLPLAALCSNGQ